MARAVRQALGSLLLLLGVIGYTSEASGFRSVELQCEEAVAHLRDCCPVLKASIECTYEERDCDPPIEPDLTESESRCIRELTCDEIVARELCTDASLGDPDAERPRCS